MEGEGRDEPTEPFEPHRRAKGKFAAGMCGAEVWGLGEVSWGELGVQSLLTHKFAIQTAQECTSSAARQPSMTILICC